MAGYVGAAFGFGGVVLGVYRGADAVPCFVEGVAVSPFAVVADFDGFAERWECGGGVVVALPGGVGLVVAACCFGVEGVGAVLLALGAVGFDGGGVAVGVVDVDGDGVACLFERGPCVVDDVGFGLAVAAVGDSPGAECAKPAETNTFQDGVGSVAFAGAVDEGSVGVGVGDGEVSHGGCPFAAGGLVGGVVEHGAA